MTSLEERDKIIKEIIKPAFKKLGFKTFGNNFAKEEDRFIKVFSLENSSWNEFDYVNFTLHIGILFPIVEEIRNRPISKVKTASGCHFEITTNQLNNSNWNFVISPDTNIEELRKDISSVINDYVIPFFERYSKIEDCIDLATSYISYKYDIKPFIGLSLIEKGHIELGQKLLDDINTTYIESFKKQLLDHRDYLISKHKSMN